MRTVTINGNTVSVSCPSCGSENIISRGRRGEDYRFQCLDCYNNNGRSGGYFTISGASHPLADDVARQPAAPVQAPTPVAPDDDFDETDGLEITTTTVTNTAVRRSTAAAAESAVSGAAEVNVPDGMVALNINGAITYVRRENIAEHAGVASMWPGATVQRVTDNYYRIVLGNENKGV